MLARLFEEREPIYSQADLSVTSMDGPHQDTVQAILKALEGWQADV